MYSVSDSVILLIVKQLVILLFLTIVVIVLSLRDVSVLYFMIS